LSAYAKDPQEAAESLVSLLEEAEKVVPVELRDQTPVRVGVSNHLPCLQNFAIGFSGDFFFIVEPLCRPLQVSEH
jgi:hypothetical protein